MKIAKICVSRPVFTTMLMTLLLVIGVFSYFKLGVDLLPNVDFPMVTISANLPGASPEEVETELSKKIEEAVNSVSGIDELRSTSTEGQSRVTVQFLLEKNSDVAAQEVRDKISSILKKLPSGIDPPEVSKIDPSAQSVITLVVSGKRNLLELSELARKQVKEALETVYGVGEIEIRGSRARVVNVFIDRNKLEQYKISINAVKNSIISQNMEVPLGRVTQKSVEYTLRALGRFYTINDFNNMIISWAKNRPIMLSDVGYAENSEEEPRSLSRLDGETSVSLGIKKQGGTNTVKVVDAILEKIKVIQKTLPADIKLTTIGDQSRFIRSSISEVELHLFIGALLASLVVYIFMGNFRATLIAAVSIPISIIATFILMLYMGFTLNNMTLLGLALAVGIVIDDAIVVLENIFRIMEEKKLSPVEAAVEGTAEIALAVMATTISLIVIFLPVAFMSGMAGRLFQSYGITVAFAIGISLFVAFTSTPMLCSVFFKKNDSLEDHNTSENRLINRVLNKGYSWLLHWSLNNKALIILTAALTIYMIIPLVNFIGKDFMPTDDTSEFSVSITTPSDWTLTRVNNIVKEIEGKIKKVTGVKALQTTIGSSGSGSVGSARIFVVVEDLKNRDYPQTDVMNKVRKIFSGYPELRAGVQANSGMGGGGMGGGGRSAKLNFSISGPDLKVLDQATAKMKEELSKIKGFIDVDTTTDNQKPEYRIDINRQKMAEMGLQVSDFVTALKTLIGGETVSRYKDADEQFDIILRLMEKDRNIPALVKELKLQNKAGVLIPISNFVKIDPNVGPSRIERINRERQMSLVSDLDDKVKSLSEAVADINKAFNNLKLPVSYRLNLLGQAKMLSDTLINFLLAFVLSFILMYIVLASQFESFLHPVTILLTLPLSVPFAIISLLITGETLNLYSILGLFMLFGIVKKNAILQIDYTNTLRERGVALYDAIIQANLTRLRPILMTTLTLIAGMLPIALGKGPGAASRASMAKVIIGGQFLCLLLTLLIVPVAYYLFAVASEKITTYLKKKTGRLEQ
ncbi:MAG: efflux RND transporter permease subunit [Candidatus Wallbacteria bacterium]